MASRNKALTKFDNGDRVSDAELHELITHFTMTKQSLEAIADSSYHLVYLDVCSKLDIMLRYKKSRSSKVQKITWQVEF